MKRMMLINGPEEYYLKYISIIIVRCFGHIEYIITQTHTNFMKKKKNFAKKY